MPDATPARGHDRERESDQERQLIDRLVVGDRTAWEEFHACYAHRVAGAVRSAGVDDGDNGDACSFVFEGLLANDYRRLRRWDGTATLSTYLYTVSRRLAIDFLRNRPRVVRPGEEEILDSLPDVHAAVKAETHALQSRLREAILECFLRIPNGAEREILLLHFHAGLPADEIARLSGRTRNAVDQALHRARRSLREVAERVHPDLAEYLEEDRRDW